MGQQTLAGWVSRTPKESQSRLETAQPNIASDNKRGWTGSDPIEIADDSDADEVQEQPPSKRRRTSQRDGDEASDDGLDDGEVADMSSNVNSREASNPAHSPPRGHAGWNEGVKPAGLRISFGSAVTSAARKQATVPTSREPETMADSIVVRESVTGTSAEETIVVQEPVAAEPTLTKSAAKKRRRQERKAAAVAAAAMVATSEQQAATSGEAHLPKNEHNTRAQALKAAEATAATKQQAPAAHAGEQKNQQAVPRKRNRRYKFGGQTWLLPPSPGPEWGPDESRTWQFKFEQWLQDYVALNNREAKMEILRDPKRVSSVLQDAYSRWQMAKGKEHKEWKKKAGVPLMDYRNKDMFPLLISTIEQNLAQGESMSPMPPLIGAAAGEVTEVSLRSDAPVMEPNATSPLEEPVQENSPASRSSGEVSEHTEDLQGDEEMDDVDEKAYRERYYPGITDDQVFCTSCASFGHRSRSCPEANCRFCGDSEHMSPGCPTRQRCSKCKQLGHTITHCREKLSSLAPEEGTECAFCASQEHTESYCAEFFRAYRPSQETIRKVKHIPIFCYCCGNEGHYGNQCGLNPKSLTKYASVEIWSKENWQQYVDPSSAEEAIAWDSAAGANAYAHDANGRPDFGKSIVPRTHIIFEDDDDDDEEGFIRPPVQRQQQQNGQINVSRQGRGGFSSLAQQAYTHNPPLPPGPPPGLPARPPQPNEDGKQRRRPRKPNPARHNDQGHSNGQQNGRGGGGGGGRFRMRNSAVRGRGRGGGGRR